MAEIEKVIEKMSVAAVPTQQKNDMFNPSKIMKICSWSDVTEEQAYEIHYVNVWLKRCVKHSVF